MKYLCMFISGVAWLAGIVLAKGTWSTAFAICMPFWAWYLVVEKLLINIGFI